MTVTGDADEHGIARRIGYGKKIAFGDYKNKNSVKKENKN